MPTKPDLDYFLIYRLYQSGLSNERLSLETAIGLATATGRPLLLHGNNEADYRIVATFGGGYKMHEAGWPVNGGTSWLPRYAPSTVLDIYEDLPVSITHPDKFGHNSIDKFEAILATENIFTHQLGGWCASVPTLLSSAFPLADPIEDNICEQFRDGRPIITAPSAGPWIVQGNNLGGFYSRFFYDPLGVVSAAVERMRLCSWITEFADKASLRLGKFNGCHIRLTDMLRFIPQENNYSEAVADAISSWLPLDECLLIASDGDSRSEFFDPLRKQFTNIIFLDDFLRDECKDIWESLPFINESILGLLSCLIMERSILFMGTPGSTFSGFIHRGWAQRRVEGLDAHGARFRYIHNGLRGTGSVVKDYFEQGAYVETMPGLYSWNRIEIRSTMKGSLAWYREWPECIGLPTF